MTVGQLQHTLRHLTEILNESGGRTSATELAAFSTGLERFRDQSLKTFTDLLGRMNLDGIVAPKTSGKKGGAAKASADMESLAIETKNLFDRAADPSTTEAQLDDLCKRLGVLTIPDLKAVAGHITYAVPSKDKTKAAVVGGIRRHIADRMGSSIRRQLLDRPNESLERPVIV